MFTLTSSRMTVTVLLASFLFLTWCGTTETNLVQVQKFQFSLPTAYISVPSKTLDTYNVASTVVSARKNGTSSLVLSEGTAPKETTIDTFTKNTASRIKQQTLWYTSPTVTKKTFTCWKDTLIGYLHTFTQAQAQDASTISMYYAQYYFIHQNSIYILSLADPKKNTILPDIIKSLRCTQ